MGYSNFHTSGALCEISQRCSPLGPLFSCYILFSLLGARRLPASSPCYALVTPSGFLNHLTGFVQRSSVTMHLSVYLWLVRIVTVFIKNNRPPCRNSGSVQALLLC